MQAARLIAALVLLALPAVNGASLAQFDVQFVPPVEARGLLDVQDASWALLFFTGDGSTQEFSMPGPTTWENVTVTKAGSYDGPPVPTNNLPLEHSQSDSKVLQAPSGTLSFGNASSLYVEGQALRVVMDGSAVLRPKQMACMSDLVPPTRWGDLIARYGALCPSEVGVYIEAPTSPSFAFESDSVTMLEWHHADVRCKEEASCPAGGQRSEWLVPVEATDSNVTNGVYGFERLTGSGRISGHGMLAGVLLGGPRLSLGAQGWIRLPIASSAPACDQCPAPDGQTLRLQGNVTLAGLRSQGQDGLMVGHVSGQVEGVRFDERSVDPGLLAGAVTAAATAVAVGTGILARILSGLFARNTRPVLEHPAAKALFDAVCGHPGLSFGQLRARTGLTHGPTHYHLRRLLKAGHIVAYGYRNSVRYFENHGRHKHDWLEHAVLQKPELRDLHAWIAEHPRSKQTQVVAAAATWGWTRSTTQNRIQQLVEASLLRKHRTPLAVEYVAVSPAWAHQTRPTPKDDGNGTAAGS